MSGGSDNVGTVFELSPQKGGAWTETILHSFSNNGTDGSNPSGLVFDASGNLYGTTANGGTAFYDCGVVFELSPVTGGCPCLFVLTMIN